MASIKLEEVARAIYARNPEVDRSKRLVLSWDAVGEGDPRTIPWDKAPAECRALVMKAARDAVMVLSQPNGKMQVAGAKALAAGSGEYTIFTDMMAVVLK